MGAVEETRLGGRYRIIGILGRGGMGEVYRALDETTGTTVAVKSTDLGRWGPHQREVLEAQFRREAQTLLRLDHPLLPKFLDYLEEDQQAYLVMELVPGGNLAQRISESGPLSEEILLGYLMQLCEVLDYLHKQSPPVIFRDLKPSNVMLCPDGGLKLIDFGLAKSTYEPGSEATHTGARGMVSPGFAAPEQYGGGTDERSDLYSLGATAYFLATGTAPADAVERASSGDPLISPDLLHPQLSASTALLITRLLQLKRDRRPTSAAEVLAQLQARSGLEVPTMQAPLASVRGRFPGRRRAFRWASLSLLCLVGGVAYWLLAAARNIPLHLESSPAGAEVFLDGERAGLTPCNLTVTSKTKVSLRKDGYLPCQDEPAKFAESKQPVSLWIALRPGTSDPQTALDHLPSFYPPGLGGPPWFAQAKADQSFKGHVLGIPSEWAVTQRLDTKWEIRKASMNSGTQRQASLEWRQGDRAQLLQAEVERLRVQWVLVRVLGQPHSSLAYFEDQRGGVNGRLAWLWSEQAQGNFVLKVQASPCEDVYSFIRDLEILRSGLDL